MPASRFEIGQNAYLWKDVNRTHDTLVITAHGLQAITLGRPMNLNISPLPELHYFSEHNHVTTDVGLSAISSASPVEVLNSISSPDYTLFKYTNTNPNPGWIRRHNDASETYGSVAYAAGYERYDVLTIRSRMPIPSVRLSNVIRELWSSGNSYEFIKCFFCRGFFGMFD